MRLRGRGLGCGGSAAVVGVAGGVAVVEERGLVGGRGFLAGAGGSVVSVSTTKFVFDGLLGGKGRSLDGFLGGVGLFLTSGGDKSLITSPVVS